MFEIAKVGHQRFAKTFKDIRLGKKWAKKIEHEIEIGSYEDLTLASKTTKSQTLTQVELININSFGKSISIVVARSYKTCANINAISTLCI